MASEDVAFVQRALDSWLASTSGEAVSGASPDEDGTSVAFEPTEAQARAAAHLGNRLELARITAGGTEERIAELRGWLERATRALRRAETDLETARRRLRFARHGGRSSLAELPMGEEAGAFGSVYDARGDALARAIRDASRDPARYEIAVAGLERRKTLVVDRRLADGRGGGADGG